MEAEPIKVPNNHYFRAWADYEGGTCTRCGWGPSDHGYDAYHEQDYCVFERNEHDN